MYVVVVLRIVMVTIVLLWHKTCATRNFSTKERKSAIERPAAGVPTRERSTEWSCRELNPPEERRSRPAGELASGQAGQRNEVELPGIEPAGGAAQPPGG